MSNSNPWKPLYNTAQWKHLRLSQLSIEPLCRFCDERGKIEPANVVDHIIAHKGKQSLFFNPNNLQSLCKQCHDKDKAVIERGALVIGNDGWAMS
jgi:5-methylcytosine-specific restriction enzyme A